MQTKSFEALWKHYVPRDGPPRNEQGEALRAVARISHEVSINECANWGPELESSLDTLKQHLSAATQLDAPTRTAALRDIESVRAQAPRGSAAAAELTEAVRRVKEAVVAWCNQRLSSQARE